MATAASTGSGAWSAAIWSGGSGSGGAPADGDNVTIAAGHSVLMDTDLSAWTGLLNVVITGGATPGMLYFKNGTNGYLKIRTGYTLSGTTSTNRGRLLANSDGVWETTTALTYANKAIIDLQGTAYLNAANLDMNLRATEPANKYVRTYGSKYDFTASESTVSVANDTIDLGVAPPSADTPVKIITATGVLPGGLSASDMYYVRSVSGNTCKLSLQKSDAQIVNITSTGSGTVSLITGHTNTSTDTMNVLDDVTADTPWVTTDGHDRVVLVDCNAPEDYDQQRLTLVAINAGTIQLSANVDSAQYPGARIYLSSRNVSIRSAGTSTAQNIIDYGSSTFTGSTIGAEITNTAGSGTTFYGRGISAGSGHTISGTVSGCTYGIYYGSGHTISGTVSGCTTGIYYGSGHTISGTISGCIVGINYGSGHTISGTVSGCNTGIYSGSGYTISGTVSGCTTGINFGSGYTISGTVSGCIYGIYYGSGYTISGTISGCIVGIRYAGFLFQGTFTGNGTDVSYSGNSLGPLLLGKAFNYAGTDNDTRAWSAGGAMTHETSVVPDGKSYSHKFTHVDSGFWTRMDWEISPAQVAHLSIPIYSKHNSTGLTADNRLHWQIIDPASDPLAGGTALAEWIAEDSTDWQQATLTYDRPDDRLLLLRVCAKRGSGNSYALADPAAGGGCPVMGGMIVR